MTYSFISPPNAARFVLSNATVPAVTVEQVDVPVTEGLATVDIVISDGMIAAIRPAGTAPTDYARTDLKDGMVWPCFADIHTHLDKGHIWPRQANPDGSFMGALDAVRADREANWSAADVKRRMEFSLRSAYAHGTSLIRTHLDSLAPQHRISFGVFAEIRDAWKDRIALQAVALFPLDAMADSAFFTDLVTTIRQNGGLLGGVTRMGPELVWQLDTLFGTAAEQGLDVDLHVDETDDRGAETLKAIAEAVLRNGFEGKVTAGHCCSLARQDEDTAARTVELVAKAGIAVISLPMCNMYLQDRYPGRTPRWRGVTCSRNWPPPVSRPRSHPTIPATPSMPMAISIRWKSSARPYGYCISTIRSIPPPVSSPPRPPPSSDGRTRAASPPAILPISCSSARGAGVNSCPVRSLTASCFAAAR